MFRHRLIALLILIFLPTQVFSQQGKLRGRITEKGTNEPLIGVNVTIAGTRLGGSTDASGVYIIPGVTPGTYSIKASFTGYQAQIISNIQINSDLTTTRDFTLNRSSTTVEAIEFVAEHPLLRRNATNTIHIATAEDIKNSSARGIQNILALNAGVAQQGGMLYIRGGRGNEIMYYIDGIPVNNPLSNGQSAAVIHEAIEEIQLQAGGFTAEYGGSNSGIVKTFMRTGGSKFKATMDYRSDDFAGPGEEFLGTTSRGYKNISGTMGGPIGSRIRFYVAGQRNSQANRTRLFIEPFDFSGNPVFQSDDGLEGRFKGQALPGPVAFKRNWLPGNGSNDQSLQGTLTFALSNSLRFRFSGISSKSKVALGRDSFYAALNDLFSKAQQESHTTYGMAGVKMMHHITPSLFYELNVNWSKNYAKTIDPLFGDDWQKYADSREWEAAGRDASDWSSVFRQPINYSIINNFQFHSPNKFINSYSRHSQNTRNASFALSAQLHHNIELKIGANAERHTARHFSVGNIANWLTTLWGYDGNSPNEFIDPQGRLSPEFLRKVYLIDRGNIQNWGWDYNGEKKVDGGVVGARTPAYSSAYFQSKFEYRDLDMNIGLRYEKMDTRVFGPADLENPDVERESGWVYEDNFSEINPHTFLLPRLNFAFAATDNSIFYAQYGKYAQRPPLTSLYNSINTLRGYNPLFRFGTAGFLAEPEQTNQYELGIRQALTSNLAFDITAYYKDASNLWHDEFLFADGSGNEPAGTRLMRIISNNEVATSKGLELTLTLHRTKRLAARFNYSLRIASDTDEEQEPPDLFLAGAPSRFLSHQYNQGAYQPHRGTATLDYRFARGDGPLQGSGINLHLKFNSGHHYTLIRKPENFGQETLFTIGVRGMLDHYTRSPVEPVNSSSTPWNFDLDLHIDKMFYFDKFNFKFYSIIRNALNFRNVLNVYPTTGVDDDDAWLSNPLAQYFLERDGYEEFYRTINLKNGWAWRYASGTELWGEPREIQFGIQFEFH